MKICTLFEFYFSIVLFTLKFSDTMVEEPTADCK